MNDTKTPLIGQPLLRVEDERFLRGNGVFAADLEVPGALHGAVVRSPYAHARIVSIDTSGALAADGVSAVLTAQSLAAVLAGPIPSFTSTAPWDIRNIDGNTLPDGSMPVLATDRVRYPGEAIAFVVADTAAAAESAAERVVVEYEELPAVVSYDAAVAPDAICLWDELADNTTMNIERGNSEETDTAFAAASRVVRCEVDVNRIVPVFMEPRSVVGEFLNGRFHLKTGAQSSHGLKNMLSIVLGVEPEDVLVQVPDMGGGFGARNSLYPEFALVLLASRQLGSPVRWTASRSESFLTDAQARDQRLIGELALDGDGRFLALRATMHWRHGGYLWSRNASVLGGFFPPTSGGVYQIPAIHVMMKGAFTNTAPQAAYRGIGRLESNYLIERLVDHAARELGRDGADLRRQNMITPEQMPWKTPTGSTYTSGEFQINLDRALVAADADGFAERATASERLGRLRGLGIGMYVENDGASPSEYSYVEVLADDVVRFGIGTQDFGMGHQTMYAQIAADTLELSFEQIEIFFGDTDRIAKGFGSAGSRSARLGGSAIVNGALAALEVAREEAAELLEVSSQDLEYAQGRFTVSGTDRSMHLFEIASDLKKMERKIQAEGEFVSTDSVHQNGCQICEVEIDPETGVIRIDRHTIVADVGRAVNPMIVDGQLHGGITQGLGQAGYEHVVFDEVTGQVLSGSLMDYNIPKADDMPVFATELNELIEADNPVGVKGAGEGPTAGAPGAFVNAAISALAPLGVTDLQMPLTPQRVWQAIQNAQVKS